MVALISKAEVIQSSANFFLLIMVHQVEQVSHVAFLLCGFHQKLEDDEYQLLFRLQASFGVQD